MPDNYSYFQFSPDIASLTNFKLSFFGILFHTIVYFL